MTVTIEYRVAEATLNGDTLVGLVTPFGVETEIGDAKRDGFHEKVNAGAFTKTLQERDVVLIHNHNTAWPLARTSIKDGDAGSLTLVPDPTAGLRAAAIPVQTSVGKDVLALAKAGVIRGMSFGFEVIKDRWTDGEGRASDQYTGTHREILEVRLHEVTTTAFPAYPTSELSARDLVSAARGVAETRADSEPDDSEGKQNIASVDAILDEALKLLNSGDRNSLPPEVNQAIDLLHGAQKNIGAHMKGAGIPDPDKPNGNDYSEPASATPDESERADMAALANHYILERDAA